MIQSRLSAAMAIVGLLLLGTAATADKGEQVHSGTIVSVTADMLVMTDAMGKNMHTHKVEVGTAVTLDFKPAKATELMKGDAVKIAVGQDGKVTRIEAMRAKKKIDDPKR